VIEWGSNPQELCWAISPSLQSKKLNNYH